MAEIDSSDDVETTDEDEKLLPWKKIKLKLSTKKGRKGRKKTCTIYFELSIKERLTQLQTIIY